MDANFPCECGHKLFKHTGKFDAQENWYDRACLEFNMDGDCQCPAFRPNNLKYLERLSLLRDVK
jgi:hypothetical protein